MTVTREAVSENMSEVFNVSPELQRSEHGGVEKSGGSVVWARTAGVRRGLSEGLPEAAQGRKPREGYR